MASSKHSFKLPILTVLSFLSSAPGGQSEDLNNVFVKVLWANVTSLIQPMNQGIIDMIKKNYRKLLLQHLIVTKDEEEPLNFSKCASMITKAWHDVPRVNLKRSWRTLLPESELVDSSACAVAPEPDLFIQLVKEVPGFEECSDLAVHEWLRIDEDDPGYRLLSDDEILASLEVQEPETNLRADQGQDDVSADLEGEEEQEVNGEDDETFVEAELIESFVDTEDEEEQEQEDMDEVNAECSEKSRVLAECPSDSEAFQALTTALQWFQSQEEADDESLCLLNRIRDLAAAKRDTPMKQEMAIMIIKEEQQDEEFAQNE